MGKGMYATGDKALIKKLRDLSSKAAPKVNRRAANLGGTPILQAVKENVPVDHGDLKKATVKKMSNKGMVANCIIGADRNYVGENGSRPYKYDFLVEGGHVGEDGVVVPANPYLRKGWDESISAARAKYESELSNGIEKEAAK